MIPASDCPSIAIFILWGGFLRFHLNGLKTKALSALLECLHVFSQDFTECCQNSFYVY